MGRAGERGGEGTWLKQKHPYRNLCTGNINSYNNRQNKKMEHKHSRQWSKQKFKAYTTQKTCMNTDPGYKMRYNSIKVGEHPTASAGNFLISKTEI